MLFSSLPVSVDCSDDAQSKTTKGALAPRYCLQLTWFTRQAGIARVVFIRKIYEVEYLR